MKSFFESLETIINLLGGEKTLRLLLMLAFIIFITQTFLDKINTEFVKMFNDILTGSGFANLVTLAFGILSITISIKFFILSENRSSHSSEKSNDMLVAAQQALSEIRLLIEHKFDSTEGLANERHKQLLLFFQEKQKISNELESTVDNLQKSKTSTEGQDNFLNSIEDLKKLLIKNTNLDYKFLIKHEKDLDKILKESPLISSFITDEIANNEIENTVEKHLHVFAKNIYDKGYRSEDVSNNPTIINNDFCDFIKSRAAYIKSTFSYLGLIYNSQLPTPKCLDKIINQLSSIESDKQCQ